MANLSQYYPSPIIAGSTTGTYADGGRAAFTDVTNTFAQSQILSGTNNTAPSQTAASGSSLITRDLGENWLGVWGRPILSSLNPVYTNGGTGAGSGAAQTTWATNNLMVSNTSTAGSYSRAVYGSLASMPGSGASTALNRSWTVIFDATINGITNNRWGLIFGSSTSPTTLALSARSLAVRFTTDTSATLVIHDGTTETTATVTIPTLGIGGNIVRFAVVWNSSTNTLSLFTRTLYPTLGSPTLAGSVTANPAATIAASNALAFMNEATGTPTFSATLQWGGLMILPYAITA